MAGVRQTVERRQLGLVLKRLRTGAGVSQAEAARVIDRQQTRISRAEAGKGSLSIEQLTALLDRYDASEDDRELVLSLGAQARRRQRGATYTDILPGGFHRLADLEADATAIRYYEVGIFPGLIQSPEYLGAVIRACDGMWWDSSAAEVESRIAFRLEQQRRVFEAPSPKELRFVFTEDALRHPVGDASVMRGQILHMLGLLERQEGMSLRVIPSGIADNPALGGGFILMDFAAAPRCGSASVVFGPSTYHDEPADTSAMLRTFDRLEELGLPPQESRAFLLAALKEM